jgi:hypothetical protein
MERLRISAELARELSSWISGVTPPARAADKAEYAPTTTALFGQSDALSSVDGISLCFLSQAVENCVATRCKDVIPLIEAALQRTGSLGCSARLLVTVLYHVDTVGAPGAVWCDAASLQ